MIKICDMTVKNFMSVGNVSQAVAFDKVQLTLVLGENLDQGGDDSGSRNGTGKTTIINALSYALYGQALTNIKRNNLINKTNNKGMLVTLNFEKDGITYRIERGRSPNVLKYFVNNEEIETDANESQGDSRNTQLDINNLLGMSHDMFKHIVALNTYTEPFLSMRTNDQRLIIEQLLGVTLLSEKAEGLKQLVREVKDAIVQETAKINAIEASNKKIGETIKSTELRQKAWRTKQANLITSLTKKLHDLEEVDIEAELAKHDQLAKWTTLNDNLTSLVKEQSSLETSLARAEKDVIKAEKNLSALNDDLCYACGQDLHEEKKAEIVAKKDKEFADATTYYQEIANKLEVVNLDIEKVGELNGKPLTFYETAREAYEHQNNVQALIATIKEKQEDEDPYEDQIHQLKNSAIQEINWDAINDFNTYKDHQEFVLKLLTSKDSFIRKKIIDQNLAYLNNRLTYYLAKTGLPHQIKFLNDLSIEITQLGQDLDFDNLSRGERNRLILGMSWAFRDVWESLYNGINLLFIDELIDSGMDTAGVESCLSILKKMGRDRSKNVFLISHKDELVGRVNYVLKVVKENGFTSYANDVDVVVE
jgi:DNA repair exonuclease SbcCD ATPase subunit